MKTFLITCTCNYNVDGRIKSPFHFTVNAGDTELIIDLRIRCENRAASIIREKMGQYSQFQIVSIQANLLDAG